MNVVVNYVVKEVYGDFQSHMISTGFTKTCNGSLIGLHTHKAAVLARTKETQKHQTLSQESNSPTIRPRVCYEVLTRLSICI